MRLTLDAQGDWYVDPADLARRLGITPALLRRQMRLGQVTSQLESGSGEDEGRTRVTVRLARSGWQGIFGTDGALISEESV